jgi:hypothetical protein
MSVVKADAPYVPHPLRMMLSMSSIHERINSDLSRIAVPTERDLQRTEKYRRAINLIGRIPA